MAKGRKTGGRQKGTPNKINALLKDDILKAAELAHPDGRVGYLREQANENPSAFMTLLGKILPTQVEGDVVATVVRKTIYEAKPDDA